MSLTVTAIKSDHNMIFRHELRDCPQVQRLRPGQCLVAYNSALTIARIVDCEGGIHDYYAPPGEQFDTSVLSQMLQRGIGVELQIRPNQAHKLDHREAIEISKAPKPQETPAAEEFRKVAAKSKRVA